MNELLHRPDKLIGTPTSDVRSNADTESVEVDIVLDIEDPVTLDQNQNHLLPASDNAVSEVAATVTLLNDADKLRPVSPATISDDPVTPVVTTGTAASVSESTIVGFNVGAVQDKSAGTSRRNAPQH